jgi:hypothetical protein
LKYYCRVMVFNTTFNNISVKISSKIYLLSKIKKYLNLESRQLFYSASFFRHFETRRYLWYLILCSILIHPSCLNRGSDGAMGSWSNINLAVLFCNLRMRCRKHLWKVRYKAEWKVSDTEPLVVISIHHKFHRY